jgi:hypothetical protein
MKKIQMTYIMNDGREKVFNFPARNELCERCDGEGTHVNPSVDGNGLTAEDFDEDPDFREHYFAGVFDVACEECHGNKVVQVVDEEALRPSQRRAFRLCSAQANEIARERSHEKWMRDRGIQF